MLNQLHVFIEEMKKTCQVLDDKFVKNAKEELIEEEKANIEKLSSEIETIQKTLSSLDN